MVQFGLIFPWVIVALLAAAYWSLRRKHAQVSGEAARVNRTLFRIRQAVDGASDAIGIGDMEGHSLYHNKAHETLFGYSVDELNAIPGGGVLFADPVVASAIHTAIRAGHSWAGEAEVRARDGRVVPCFVRADVVYDEKGRAVGIFGVFTDITERLRTQQQLDEQRQRLEFTLQSIGDAVITTDAAGRIVLMNPIAEQYTGKLSAHVVGHPLAEVLKLLDEHTRAPRPSSVLDLLRTGRESSRSADAFVLVGPGGSERLVAENAALIRLTSGEPLGAVVALRDVTRERRRAEESARTVKLESLGLLAGGIAHDFGNLLTAMVGHVAIAQSVPGLPEAAAKRLAELDRAVWRAKDITQQLFNFAKGGAPKKSVVNLPAVIREAANYAIGGTQVSLRCMLATDLYPVEADEGQIVQVINNLAVNAVQAMPHGGTLLIAAENYDPERDSQTPLRDGRWVRIAVTDTGTGIAPEHLAKIFEPFFTTKPKGTGLGLATCYAVVKRHGGQLRVESHAGHGTTFHIILPASPSARPVTLATALAASPLETAPAAPTTTVTANPFRVEIPARKTRGRILLMDDERLVREAVTLMLGLLDYDVVQATSGAEVLEKYAAALREGRRFSAVLLDLRVPEGMGGAETMRRLREMDPHACAIAASGYHDDPVLLEFRQHGFTGKLAKPFKMDELGASLKKLLEEPRG